MFPTHWQLIPAEQKTVMKVKDGRTVVLGGLIKDEKVDTIKKVPLLGDIPILGFSLEVKINQMRRQNSLSLLHLILLKKNIK